MESLFNVIWEENTATGQTVIVLIGCLLTASLASALANLCRYALLEASALDTVIRRLGRWKEQRSSERVEKTGESQEDSEASIEEEVEDCSLIDLSELRRGVPDNSIIGDRLRAIGQMRTSQVKVSVGVLQQLSIGRETSKLSLRLPEFAVGFSMLLGLLGTVAGLAFLVQDIHSTIGVAAKPGALVENVRKILSPMKTAFSATFVGLVCSISAAALNFFLGRIQARFFDRLERFTIEELLPATAPSTEDETLLERVSMQLERSFTRLSEISQQNGEALKDLNGIEKAFLRIIGNVEQIAKDRSQANSLGLVSELAEVIGELGKVNRTMLGVSENLPRMLTFFQRNGGQVANAMEEMVSLQREQNSRALSTGSTNSFFPARAIIAILISIIVVLVAFGLLRSAG